MTTSTEPQLAAVVPAVEIDAFARSAARNNDRSVGTVPIGDISLWSKIENVQPNQDHISKLTESIRLKGLVEPLVVDNRNRLVAGRHRFQALAGLASSDEARFQELFPEGKIPVAILPFDAEEKVELGMAVMIAENQHHRRLKEADFKLLHTMLTNLGYEPGKAGRPVDGAKPSVNDVITHALNMSTKTFQRYAAKMDGADDGEKSAGVKITQLARTQKAIRKLSAAEFKELKHWLETSYTHVPLPASGTVPKSGQAEAKGKAAKRVSKPVKARKAAPKAIKKKKPTRK